MLATIRVFVEYDTYWKLNWACILIACRDNKKAAADMNYVKTARAKVGLYNTKPRVGIWACFQEKYCKLHISRTAVNEL